MYSPKGRPMGTGEVTKQHDIRARRVQSSSSFFTLRGLLLIWAYLRLVVSVLWTGLIIFAANREPSHREQSRLFASFAIVLQEVEFGMLVTFIRAGLKRSASLYRAYYRYCIFTLIIYIIVVIMCSTLDYENGHYFGEIYITYHISDLPIFANDALLFGVPAILDICLEILLIRLIKRLINKYSSDEDNTNCENV